MSLQDEISARASQIYRESYQMSIGELVHLYKDEELDIHPEFQRVFRWNESQKTKLIESIMLNIPIPPIFVSQDEEGVWDVIDGVQRLSTIFEFLGILKNNSGELFPPMTLMKTDYLPSFAGVQWENENPVLSFTKEQQLRFKRSRLDIIIMKRESDPIAKYELFQRLNTGGTKLSDQEVRNCLMIMSNPKFFDFISALSTTESFVNCLPISDRKTDEQYRTELLLRLLIPGYINWANISKYPDFATLLDKETLILCETMVDFAAVQTRFESTFNFLYGLFDENVFKRFNGNKYIGSVMAASFQTIATGVYTNIDQILVMEKKNEWLTTKVQALYDEEVFLRNIASGVRSIPRFKELSLFGVEYFKP
jgi:hypothetical protein